MRKHLLLIVLVCTSFFAKGQFFTFSFSSSRIHVNVSDTLSHDTMLCGTYAHTIYYITVDSSFAGDSLRIVDTSTGLEIGPTAIPVNTSGASPWILTVDMGAGLSSYGIGDAGVTAGGGYRILDRPATKVTTALDTLPSIQFKDSLWILPCIYGNISGNVYIDHNTNCIFDSGDMEIEPARFQYTTHYTGSGIITYERVAASMPYSLICQKSWLISYTLALPDYMPFIFPYSPCFTTIAYTDSVLPVTGVDFPLQCTHLKDIQCYPLSAGTVRLHAPFYITPYVSNTGCDTTSGTLTLIKDSRTIYDASLSSLPASVVHGDTLIWYYHALTNVLSGPYWNSLFSNVYLTQGPTVAAGDTLCFRVYTNIPLTDINPANNDYTVCIPVVYSHDPNSKSVVPAGTGPLGILPPGTDTLTYTINFQNTGTDYAEDVVIIDTLDSHLNPSSLRILGTSAKMMPKWLASNVVQFTYSNIMLPDSMHNEPASHGQVRFSIALNAGVPVGTTISNTGYIYFDTNPAVVTNTTKSTVPTINGTGIITTATGLKIYPNPATDLLHVDGMNTGAVSILSISGATLSRQTINSSHTTIDVGQLPPGVYLLHAISSNETATVRFTKY